MATSTQLLAQDRNGLLYAVPTSPTSTVKVKHKNANKKIDGVSLINNICEIAYNKRASVTVGDRTVNDPIAMHIRFSGATLSLADQIAMMDAFVADWATFKSSNTLQGFALSDAPSI